MNSDRFDRIVFELLYGELDELTALSARRHVAQSPRAREIFAQLHATRELTALPRHAPSPDLTDHVLARVTQLNRGLPLTLRTGKLITTLAGYAMRPQVIMGALLLLMLGSSLVLIRARPGQHGPVQVTERGAPEMDQPRIVALRPGFEASLPSVVASQPSAFSEALALYRTGHYRRAQRRFETLSKEDPTVAAPAALYAARSVRMASGCRPAVAFFERVLDLHPGSEAAHEATWRSAQCLAQSGKEEAARQKYQSLLSVKGYASRARSALARQ